MTFVSLEFITDELGNVHVHDKTLTSRAIPSWKGPYSPVLLASRLKKVKYIINYTSGLKRSMRRDG
jgi:hypothetical protein